MACIKTDYQKYQEGVHPLSIIRNNVEDYKFRCQWYLGEEPTPEGIYDTALQTSRRLKLTDDTVDEYKPYKGRLNK